jgi:hypothetical protein
MAQSPFFIKPRETGAKRPTLRQAWRAWRKRGERSSCLPANILLVIEAKSASVKQKVCMHLVDWAGAVLERGSQKGGFSAFLFRFDERSFEGGSVFVF